VFLAMPAARESFVATIATIVLSGIASWSVTAPQQHRVISLAPPGAEALVVSLNAAVMYLAISLSSVIGGLGLRTLASAASLLPAAAAFVIAAALLTWISGRSPLPGSGPSVREPDAVAGNAGVSSTAK
jgi:DHA1 family inner membrane transport protein